MNSVQSYQHRDSTLGFYGRATHQVALVGYRTQFHDHKQHLGPTLLLLQLKAQETLKGLSLQCIVPTSHRASLLPRTFYF